MASRRTLAIAALALLAAAATSGCLMEDFVPEPWVWRDVEGASDSFQSPDYSTEETVELADRTNRVRVRFNVTLENNQDDPFTSSLRQGPGLNLTISVPGGNTYEYFFDSSETLRDLYPGTSGGTLTVTVQARGQGSWNLDLAAYEPKHEDWEWYSFWERI